MLNKHPFLFFKFWLSAPFIYGLLPVVVVFDICIEIYHRVCFFIYGLPYVRRRNYIKLDRQKLSYLNWAQKFNCIYCGYVNGFLNYAVKIAGDTEKFWCGIKHKQEPGFVAQPHQKNFLSYDDEKAYKDFIKK